VGMPELGNDTQLEQLGNLSEWRYDLSKRDWLGLEAIRDRMVLRFYSIVCDKSREGWFLRSEWRLAVSLSCGLRVSEEWRVYMCRWLL
jgi:hypothetical protein